MTRWLVLTIPVAVMLVFSGVAVCVNAAEPEHPSVSYDPAPSDCRPVRGSVCIPYAGVLVRPADLLKLFAAQDDLLTEKATVKRLEADLAAEKMSRSIDAKEALDRRLAVEEARKACEASRVPPRVEKPWSGWPWVGALAGFVGGVAATVVIVDAVR